MSQECGLRGAVANVRMHCFIQGFTLIIVPMMMKFRGPTGPFAERGFQPMEIATKAMMSKTPRWVTGPMPLSTDLDASLASASSASSHANDFRCSPRIRDM